MRLHRSNMQDQLRKPPEVSKRPYFQVSNRFAASIVLGTALAFGTVGATSAILFTPRAAMAQELQVAGIKVDTLRLGDSIPNLDRETQKQYQFREDVIEPRTGRRMNIKQHPDCLIAATVVPNTRSSLGFSLTDKTIPEDKRMWQIDISGFTSAIEKLTGQKIVRFKVLIEITEEGESREKVITAYAIPLNERGQILGQHEGGYLTAAASYYTTSKEFYGGAYLALEPGVQEPIARR
ncbi:MAG: hypothetical protein ABH842_00500 [Candidatus Micrarchaeota archaeon]